MVYPGPPSPSFLFGCGVARIGVSALNHKVFNHAVKQKSVVKTFLDEFYEVVAMLGCFVVQFNHHVAHICGKKHFHTFVGGGGNTNDCREKQQSCNGKPFHV